MTPQEGSRVSYIGRPEDGPEMGTQGRLLAVTGSSGHVKWEGGSFDGQLTLTHLDDIVVTSRCNDPSHDFTRPHESDALDDSLDFGRTAVREDDLLADYWNEG